MIKVRHLKLATGLILGFLIGAMLTGAFIVPFFGDDRLIVGAVAGIVTIVASAYVGLRASMVFAGR